jgi:PAS domain S-box-containing protein
MTGYPPEETLGRNCRFLQGEDTDPEKVAALREAIDNEETISVELRNYRKDGTEFWNRLTVNPIHDDDGQLVRYLGTQKDITEKKESEQKLALVETLFEYTEECQFIIDVADGEFELRHANQYYKETVGLPANTPVTGETPRELFGETGGQQVLDWYKKCVKTQDSVSYTVELPVPEEGTVYRTILTPVATDGEVTHIVGTARDITDRLDRQQELEAVNSQYQALVENFPGGGVFLLDQNMRFVRAGGDNLAEIDLTGADFEGNTPHDLYPGEVADEQIQYLEKTFDGESHTYRQEFQGAHYELRTMPIRDHTGEVVYAMAVSRDITQQVERKHEVQRQNERLEEFASIVSHDLRNPLRVADGRLELIREECESAHIDDVAQALDRMDTLIEDLLTLAREGHRVDEIESVELANVATNSWQTVNTKQATVETGTTQTIQADRSRLQQLFENLYRNAVEHGGDDVTVSVGAIDDGFYVADSGPGIPESDREDVFEAGYSTNEDGTGFGLRIVEQIADAHGWEITVTESEQGGARFEITGVEKGA